MQQIHRVGERLLHQSSDSLPLKANPVITLFSSRDFRHSISGVFKFSWFQVHGLIYLLAALAGSAYLFAAYRLYVIDLSSNRLLFPLIRNKKKMDITPYHRGLGGLPSSNNQGNE
jgi:hypothetical protein